MFGGRLAVLQIEMERLSRAVVSADSLHDAEGFLLSLEIHQEHVNFLSSLFTLLTLLLSFFLYLKMVLYARDCSCTMHTYITEEE